MIAVTLQRLVDDATRFWSAEEQLVLDALRRSANRLNNASNQELAAYVSSLSPEQLRGVTSNVKGIYHELLFVHAENSNENGITAEVFPNPNHPGADVEFLVDGESIHILQLKAVATPQSVLEHLDRYPEIEVRVTAEVADRLEGVESSGFKNDELTAKVDGVFGALPEDSLGKELLQGGATSALVAGAFGAAKVLREGRVSKQQFASAFGDVSLGLVTATALDALIERVV